MFGKTLLFTPRALGALRKLRGEKAEAAKSLLDKMATGKQVSCIKLRGHDDWFRVRDGNNPMRVLWTWYEDSATGQVCVLVIEVGYRDSNFYSDAERATGRAKHVVELTLEEAMLGSAPVPEVEDEEEEEHFEDGPESWASWPAYEYAPEDARTQWTHFLYRDFSLSPHLTKEQLGHFKELIEKAAGQDRSVAVVQGGAGSGKSVCALLAACHLHRGTVPGLENQRAHHVLYLAPERLAEKFRDFPEVEDAFDVPSAHVRTVDAARDSLPAGTPPDYLATATENRKRNRQGASRRRLTFA